MLITARAPVEGQKMTTQKSSKTTKKPVTKTAKAAKVTKSKTAKTSKIPEPSSIQPASMKNMVILWICIAALVLAFVAAFAYLIPKAKAINNQSSVKHLPSTSQE